MIAAAIVAALSLAPTDTPSSPRRYQIGDYIPTHGVVIHISDTAYLVRYGRDEPRYETRMGDTIWVPFYGPNGVDPVATIEPLVVLS